MLGKKFNPDYMDTFKTRLKQLALNKKLVFIGSALLIISVFLPWYKDIDRFKIGETFLGISGPLYLAGFIVLIAGIASFGIILLKLLEKSVPKLPLKENHLHIATSGFSILMLIMTASVYFHDKFGINLTDKSMGFGMILAFIGSGLIMLGAILSLRKEEPDFENLEGHLEPLIDLNLQEREKQDISPGRGGMTVGEAMAEHEKKEATKAWGPVQESINNYMEEPGRDSGGGHNSDNTKDLR